LWEDEEEEKRRSGFLCGVGEEKKCKMRGHLEVFVAVLHVWFLIVDSGLHLGVLRETDS
jgi:hypothetical protein